MVHGGNAEGGKGEETRGMCPHGEVVGWWWPLRPTTASVDGAYLCAGVFAECKPRTNTGTQIAAALTQRPTTA